MDDTDSLNIRPIATADRDRVRQIMIDHWGAEIVVVHGDVYRPAELAGFIAADGSEWLGLATYRVAGEQCELVTLDTMRRSAGAGTALVEAVRQAAAHDGCRRLWAITTNDNTDALRFYQKRGFVLAALHRDAIARSRQIKPEIPWLGNHDIPIRDEIELEMGLNAAEKRKRTSDVIP